MSEKQKQREAKPNLPRQIFICEPEFRQKLHEEAFKRKVSISALIRAALTKYLGWKS